MIAVIFEVDVPAEAKGEYLDWAAELLRDFPGTPPIPTHPLENQP